MRLSATRSLFERRDVIIVASVSCIYGLGSPESYYGMLLFVRQGETLDRRDLLAKLVDARYDRNDFDLRRGTFRVRGDVIEIVPAYEETGIRIELFGDEVESITSFDPLTGKTLGRLAQVAIYPSSHYVTPQPKLHDALKTIEAELIEEKAKLEGQGKLLEAQRLYQRTMFDLEMLREVGHCHGIENYSRHLSGRRPGRAAAHAARLPAQGRPDDHRRVASVDPAGARDVPRRPAAQVDPGRVRLPAALRARQPAAQLRGVRAAHRPGRLRLGHARALRAAEGGRRGGGAGHPAHRADRPPGLRAAGEGPGGRPPGRDPHCAWPPTSACSSPRSPSAWPKT